MSLKLQFDTKIYAHIMYTVRVVTGILNTFCCNRVHAAQANITAS